MRKITRCDGLLLWEGEAHDLREAVTKAVAAKTDLRGANLWGANLWGADLRDANLGGADLRGANLRGANLGDANLGGANLGGADLGDANLRDAKQLRLPTGETWTEYLTDTVPALLTAGGKTLESFGEHFQCHTWDNCPMAHAFDSHRIEDVPLLLRPRVVQFIQLFDTGQIPWPLPMQAEPNMKKLS